MAERKYEEDKVYLRGPNGKLYTYEPLLANIAGYDSVVPNPSRATRDAQKAEQKAAEELEAQQASDAAAAKEARTAKPAAAAKTDSKA